MGAKQSTNSPNSRQQNRSGYTSSAFVATGSDPGQSSSSHDRIRARTFNDLGNESRPLVVPHGLFAARYASEFGLSTTSPTVASARRRRRRERDESNETNSLPSQFFSAFLSGMHYFIYTIIGLQFQSKRKNSFISFIHDRILTNKDVIFSAYFFTRCIVLF